MKSYFYLEDLYFPVDIDEYARSSYGNIDLNRITSYIEECTENLASIEERLAVGLEIERSWPNPIRADLQLRKTTELKRIRISRQIWAPIRQLPPEVLGEIFLLCLPPMTNHRVRYLHSHKAPLVLCQVCSSWRTAIIGTPRLWNQLEFHALQMPVPVDSVEMMKVWLGRGGDLPLSLRLMLRRPWGITLPVGDFVSLEKVLSQEPLSSVCNLDISIPTSSDLYPSFKRADGFKRLELLIVRPESPTSLKDNQSHLTLLPGSPMLRRAVLIDVLSIRLSATLFPWGQLTHLYAGDNLSIRMWYRLMSYCINLRIGSFGISCLSGNLSPTEEVLLPHLSIFNIILVYTDEGFEIPFSGLVLPAMRTLRILFNQVPWSCLTDYSQLHLLRELELMGSLDVLPTDEDLVNLFQATPLLSSLRLWIQMPYIILFANLLPTANPSLLLNLEEFEIHYLVKARWWIASHPGATCGSGNFVRLREVGLLLVEMGDEPYAGFIKKSLQQCVDEGLRLLLRETESGGLNGLRPLINFLHEEVIEGDDGFLS